MSHYKHFTLIEREKLLFFVAKQLSISQIAVALGKDRSTIYRELKRNDFKRLGYLPAQAQKKYEKRRKRSKRPKLLEDPTLYEFVQDRFLNHHWSPEQISGRLALEQAPKQISYMTIYRAINAGMFDTPKQKNSNGNHGMRRRLRHKGKPRKSKNPESMRGKLLVEHWIEERPKEADLRLRFGDWEADTVLGKRGKACLLTLVDRKSRYLCCKKLPACQSEWVTKAIVARLKQLPCQTVTPDNGKEFAGFARISQELGVPVYFAHPGCPWERGTNENTNGLLREYFPKRTDLTDISEDEIQRIEADLNNRPRKTLGFHTPAEIFFSSLCCT